jgi:hypothetical protein
MSAACSWPDALGLLMIGLAEKAAGTFDVAFNINVS